MPKSSKYPTSQIAPVTHRGRGFGACPFGNPSVRHGRSGLPALSDGGRSLDEGAGDTGDCAAMVNLSERLLLALPFA
jgi:hypothetical protein